MEDIKQELTEQFQKELDSNRKGFTHLILFLFVLIVGNFLANYFLIPLLSSAKQFLSPLSSACVSSFILVVLFILIVKAIMRMYDIPPFFSKQLIKKRENQFLIIKEAVGESSKYELLKAKLEFYSHIPSYWKYLKTGKWLPWKKIEQAQVA